MAAGAFEPCPHRARLCDYDENDRKKWSRKIDKKELLLNLIFYIVITPVIGTTLTKIMFMSEDVMIVNDAINRIDEVLEEEQLSENSVRNVPSDHSITLEHVCYSYDVKEHVPSKNALNDISLSIPSRQVVAYVGRRQNDGVTPCRTFLGL